LKRRLVAQVALAVGAGVAISGTVGFVGLIAHTSCASCWAGAPHLAAGAALFGGAFLVLADALARHHRIAGRATDRLLTALVGDRSFSGCWRRAARARGCEPASGRVDRRTGRRQGADQDMSLVLAPGEFLAVIGPNGAGKSTLLGALAGDRPLAKGRVLLDGKPLAQWNKVALARRRAVLPQHSGVAFDFTGLQIASLACSPIRDRLSERQMRALAGAGPAETEPSPLPTGPTTVLSGGERQRVQARPCLGAVRRDPAGRPSCCSTSRSLARPRPPACGLASAAAGRQVGWASWPCCTISTWRARYADRVASSKKAG